MLLLFENRARNFDRCQIFRQAQIHSEQESIPVG